MEWKAFKTDSPESEGKEMTAKEIYDKAVEWEK